MMAAFFADPPEGLCSGGAYHQHVLALLDRVISEGADAPEAMRMQATMEARRWMGKIAADFGEDETERRALYDGWFERMKPFPVPFRT
jgi:hypothetical protein